MEEVFDVVDEQDVVIRQATRTECHAKGLLHRAAHILIFNKQGELLLQKRSKTIITHPLRWTSAASGHVDAGETYEHAALREAREELGVELARVEYLFTVRTRGPGDCGFIGAFIARHDGPFKIDPEEVDQVRFVSLDGAMKMDLTPTTRAVMERFAAESKRIKPILQSL